VSATAKVQTVTQTITDYSWRDSTDQIRREMVSLYVERNELLEKIEQLTPEPKKFPWWIVIAAVGGVVVLLLVKRPFWKIIILKILDMIKKRKGTTPMGANTVTNTGITVTLENYSDGYINYVKVPGGWQFQAMAGNHEALATSQVYKSKAACLKAIKTFKEYDWKEVKEAGFLNDES